MSLLGPFNVNYPVVFRSGGDTTRVAFGKHIQEIERIYGILNALDSDKLSSSDLDDKLKNFKPNLSFNDINGSLDFSRITGNLDGSRITGRIDASKVFGKLSNANIDAGNVNGLQALVKSLTSPNGDGITEVEPDENGYALFNNGFMFQWGTALWDTSKDNGKESEGRQKVSFPKTFPNKCINIFLTVSTRGIQDVSLHDDANIVTVKPIYSLISNSDFYFGWNIYWLVSSGAQFKERLKMHYFAIGY